MASTEQNTHPLYPQFVAIIRRVEDEEITVRKAAELCTAVAAPPAGAPEPTDSVITTGQALKILDEIGQWELSGSPVTMVRELEPEWFSTLRAFVEESGRSLGTRTPTTLNQMAADVAAGNQKWWIGPDGTPLTRNAGELMMLIVSEVVEAFEGERKNLMDDKLPHRRMAEVEIADAIMRLLDYAAARGYDLDGAMREKLAYNAKREDHKKESAQIAAGNPLEFVSVLALFTPTPTETPEP